jgi:hypothetical protein
MPITPLHFGVLAPINHFAKDKVSNVSFIIVNVWLDGASIRHALFGAGDYSHEGHTFYSALVLAAIVSIFGFKSRKWIYGAFLGGISHILLDMLVHTDMEPLYPFVSGNPFYMGLMEPLSLILLPFMLWFIAQCVSSILEKVKANREAAKLEPQAPSS